MYTPNSWYYSFTVHITPTDLSVEVVGLELGVLPAAALDHLFGELCLLPHHLQREARPLHSAEHCYVAAGWVCLAEYFKELY